MDVRVVRCTLWGSYTAHLLRGCQQPYVSAVFFLPKNLRGGMPIVGRFLPGFYICGSQVLRSNPVRRCELRHRVQGSHLVFHFELIMAEAYRFFTESDLLCHGRSAGFQAELHQGAISVGTGEIHTMPSQSNVLSRDSALLFMQMQVNPNRITPHHSHLHHGEILFRCMSAQGYPPGSNNCQLHR